MWIPLAGEGEFPAGLIKGRESHDVILITLVFCETRKQIRFVLGLENDV